MDVRITTRHVDLSEAFRALALERAGKLTKYEPRLIAVDVLFDDDHGTLSTEIRAEVPGRPLFVARAQDADRRKALDTVLSKLGRQLRRERDKRVDHQAPPAGATLP